MTVELLEWDRVVRFAPGHAALFPEVLADPISGVFGQDYFPRYSPEPGERFAVLAYADKAPVLLILGLVEAGRFHLCGHPARFFWARDIGPQQKATAAKRAFDYLDSLVESAGVQSFIMEELGSPSEVSQVELKCLNRGATCRTKFVGNVDLLREEDAIWREVRKSYRPLIRKGEREMQIEIIDQSNPCKAAFDQFRDFHFKISGRRTRTIESWDIQFDFVTRGLGSLVLGYQESELVSGTLTVDGDTVSYYATGVYDREKFDQPIAHAALWRSILAAKARGRETYCLGDIYPAGAGTDKERSIGLFKKGFTDTVTVSRVWEWAPKTGTR